MTFYPVSQLFREWTTTPFGKSIGKPGVGLSRKEATVRVWVALTTLAVRVNKHDIAIGDTLQGALIATTVG